MHPPPATSLFAVIPILQISAKIFIRNSNTETTFFFYFELCNYYTWYLHASCPSSSSFSAPLVDVVVVVLFVASVSRV